MRSVAKLVKVTISPTEIAPCRRMYAPTKKTQRTVSVDDARVATATTAHQERTGICASRSCRTVVWRPRTSLSMRVKLCTTGRLPSASDARSASSELNFSTRSWRISVCA